MNKALLIAALLCHTGCSAKATTLLSEPTTVGGGFGAQAAHEYISPETLAGVKKAGFGYTRVSLHWIEVEEERGVYVWPDTDRRMNQISDAGLKAIIHLWGSNEIYVPRVKRPMGEGNGGTDWVPAPFSEEAVDAFARFAGQAAARYADKDFIWEIGNEPDLARFWPPEPDPAIFASLAVKTCRAIKAANPRAVVIGPGLGRVPERGEKDSFVFLETFLKSDVVGCLDGISVHPYRHGSEAPEAVFEDYETLNLLLAKHHIYLPIINSEWGYSTAEDPEEEQAAYVLRTRLMDMLWNVPISIWYEWQGSRVDPKDYESGFGLSNFWGEPKPSFFVVERLLSRIGDATFVRQIHTKNPKDVLMLLRKPDGTQVIVGWTVRGVKAKKVTAHVRFKDQERQVALTDIPEVLFEGDEWSDVLIGN